MAREGGVLSQVETQSMTQVQTLSPQQVLEARLLQLSGVELEERVRGELLDNPALEEKTDEDVSDVRADDDMSEQDDGIWTDTPERDDRSADFLSEDDMPDYYRDPSAGRSAAEQVEEIPVSDAVSFYDVLKEQLGEQNLTDRQMMIAEYLIGSLDDSGMLGKSPESLATELAVNMFIDVDENEVEEVLRIIQEFEPAGIGARDLQECLMLQLERRPASPERDLAMRIVSECFEDFRNLRRDRMEQRLNASPESVDAAFEVLSRLNPRPGSALGEIEGRGVRHIIPDFTIETYDGDVQFSLNGFNVPELKVSRSFSDTLDAQIKGSDSDVRQTALFIRRKIDAARGFIEALHQRERTLTVTMQSIIDLQRDYFLSGDETRLRPMILKDIAEKTGLDISTVSRATSGKYAETDFGIIHLKDLFTDGVVRSDGVEVSVNEIYRIIREAVEGEDRSEPLTDDRLSEILKEHGYEVARRTVAKYRDQLGIPVSRLRKQ